MLTVGIDIGGTFTDLFLVDHDSGEQFLGKTLTTPKDPSIGSVQGLADLLAANGRSADQLAKIIHGTTLVANSLIERKGARTALITTKGFRDVLEIARERRFDMYDIFLEMPEPLIPKSLRREVTERLLDDGSIHTPLDEQEARDVVRELHGIGIESIAVCFLHAFRNAAHEEKVAKIIEEVAPGTFVSLSTEVVPEIREYERTSTTAANAYTQPLLKRYLGRMEESLGKLGFKGDFVIMLSSGGITGLETAARFPVRLVESGPAGGAIAAAYFGEQGGENRIMSFDMGGTTAKICLINDGEPMVTTNFEVAKAYRFKKGSGIPIKLPVIEMIEIGAGGGSIAHVDALGLLKVGPRSAGAEPGPACYGLGGTEPTVTDADLLLGYLNPDYFLGGEMRLDVDKASSAIQQQVADPLGFSIARAAWGIRQVVDENMANAARLYSVEKGEDYGSSSLMAFGGAGPGHAFWVADKLGIKKIIYPIGAGVTSAFGFLIAPPLFDFVRTHAMRIDEPDFGILNQLYEEMERDAVAMLKEHGVPRDDVSFVRTADMRYVGQGYEIVVPVPDGKLTIDALPVLKEAFDRGYEKLYQRLNKALNVEGLNWRLTARGPRPRISLKARVGSGSIEQAVKGTRPVYLPTAGDYVDCPVYDRYRLFPGASFQGPAIIEERESTVVVGSNARITADKQCNLTVTLT